MLDPPRTARGLCEYVRFLRQLWQYRRLGGPKAAPLAELYPQLHDRRATSPYDVHYFFQDVWAARHVAGHHPAQHVDVGSRVDYVGFLTSLTEVVFVDIRPLEAQIDRLTAVAGSVLDLPFDDRSLDSVSCLHVAEHIGLGRYGDELDPDGTRKASRELQRVVAPNGQLLFSVPVGRPRTCFNAHRIFDPTEVIQLFPELTLGEFAGVDDAGRYRQKCEPSDLSNERYAVGLFKFIRAPNRRTQGHSA